ncbi:MAG: DNA translocase FtsK 4TM domain-containing protein [Alphaproteobacteria bacterium]|nr:DNA translocase FtsK 4TM domain-containing protein [Alphaproteobacteria bacterium]
MVSIDAGRSRARPREGIHWPRLAVRLIGGLALLAALFVGLALASYDRHDPSWNHAVVGPVTNLMALPGAQLADVLLQAFGAAAVLVPLFLADWSARLMTGYGLRRFWLKLLLAPWTVPLAALALSILPAPWWWPVRSGIGGFVGQLARQGAGHLDIAPPLSAMAAAALVGTILLYVFGPSANTRAARASREKPPSLRARLFGWLPRPRLPRWRRVAVDRPVALETGPRREPLLLDATGAEGFDDEPPEMPPRRSASVDLPPRERKIKRLRQTSLALEGADQVVPSLELLAEVPPTRTAAVNEEALQQNARLLESVLEDFGVRGQIVKVRPGPVVALYELEPAAGIKASRVIGLADDIARSMSALSARVAVIPGRSVLGIELPNARSEMVFLRELLASEAYERSSAKLPLVLGKDIGGAPVIADLQRMPHLLIAGTTGSGKSVGINTMILSILYRLSSDQCKFIMIDPKMLELSMYDGIPHLLAPVVTEPRKAVVALKWTVREMENRYRAMSKLGVRNIEGYNQRIAEAKAKGEVLMRRVQTGFDEESGRPVFEEQPLSNEPLPLIVVVVDEMADLMLVAGKDIEHAVQRLAQMARAAGIHIIMATQRPSVDVITGTIKANFPTRISFQVTSKIDSRTILGEAGAEQLLGRGDMLHMAGGGRITRVHGPFVSDQEVESVVRFLKENGPPPTYLEDVTADEEDEMAAFAEDGEGSGDQLYDQAVNLVLRERKASTSFVQRHLQIGYNRAARIIERMESEGVISAANHVGKREVLGRGRD